MLVTFALFESVNDDGSGESFLVSPAYGNPIPADRLADLRGDPNPRDVDLGPLRFYADVDGLKVRRITFHYGPTVISRDGDTLNIDLHHTGLPVSADGAAYYSLLLPAGYFGHVSASKMHRETWLEDTRRLLVTIEMIDRRGTDPTVFLHSRLRQNTPPPGWASPGFERVLSRDIYRDWSAPLGYGGVSRFIRAANASLSASAPSLFLCHSSSDKEFARRLAIGLAGNGLKVWMDEAEIRVGDSLLAKIEEGIMGAKYLTVLLSRASVRSRWCREELRMALMRQIGGRGITVLPVLVEACDIPGFLQEKKYADFTGPRRFEEALAELNDAIMH